MKSCYVFPTSRYCRSMGFEMYTWVKEQKEHGKGEKFWADCGNQGYYGEFWVEFIFIKYFFNLLIKNSEENSIFKYFFVNTKISPKIPHKPSKNGGLKGWMDGWFIMRAYCQMLDICNR
jgi:hypothetical protein